MSFRVKIKNSKRNLLKKNFIVYSWLRTNSKKLGYRRDTSPGCIYSWWGYRVELHPVLGLASLEEADELTHSRPWVWKQAGTLMAFRSTLWDGACIYFYGTRVWTFTKNSGVLGPQVLMVTHSPVMSLVIIASKSSCANWGPSSFLPISGDLYEYIPSATPLYSEGLKEGDYGFYLWSVSPSTSFHVT